MDPTLYKAASEGDIATLKTSGKALDLLVTPINNTILHIYLATKQERSSHFVLEVLQLCPSLLFMENSNGDYPLHVAARYGFRDIVKLLIDQARASHHNDQALESGEKSVSEMLSKRNNKKDTALHEASRNGNELSLKVIINEDPDLKYSANDLGETPLYLAADGGYVEIVHEMLQTCSYLDYGGPNGKTVLHAAVVASFPGHQKKAKSADRDGPLKMVREILEKEKSLANKEDGEGWTPLHYASALNLDLAAKTILEIDRSSAYFANSTKKITPLHLAASRHNSAALKEILSQCPDCCQLVDARGWNVLHYACAIVNIKAIRVILDDPSSYHLFNQADVKGMTPLHLLAASCLRLDINLAEVKFKNDFPTKLLLYGPPEEETSVRIENLGEEPMCASQEEAATKWVEISNASVGKIVTIEEGECYGEVYDEKVMSKAGESVKEAQLILASLIATVTFAAGFTVPGGLKTDRTDTNRGTVIFSKNTAFQAFIITDAFALVLSTTSIVSHFFLVLLGYRYKYRWILIYAHLSLLLALGAMVLAFITGTYSMLTPNMGLAIVTCLIGLSYFCYVFYFVWSDARKSKELGRE